MHFAGFIVTFLVLLVLQQTASRSLSEEESVVSVYTTLPTEANSSHLDVYHLIANNIAEKITSPIYRALGINRSKSDPSGTTTKRPFSKIEILDDAPEEASKTDLKPVDNTLAEKDVEELSADALKKTDKKPEKITLYPSYLPAKVTKDNETINEVDADIETFGFDDDDDVDDGEDASPREGPFIFFLELMGSFFQLLYGGIAALFSSKSS